eukprot:12476957-Alexandrium_andersonii.AAC.1
MQISHHVCQLTPPPIYQLVPPGIEHRGVHTRQRMRFNASGDEAFAPVCLGQDGYRCREVPLEGGEMLHGLGLRSRRTQTCAF